jgi:predicted  nucleic acid-binding Zn-ribbon protein
VIAVIGFTAGALFASCEKTTEQKLDSTKQTISDAKVDLKDAQADYRAEWVTFKSESEKTIAANETKIDAFKEKMDKAGTRTKAKYNKDVAVLEQKNRDLKKKLDEYSDAGQDKWEQFKANFTHDLDGVGKTMTDLFKAPA